MTTRISQHSLALSLLLRCVFSLFLPCYQWRQRSCTTLILMMIINTIYCFSEASTGEQESRGKKTSQRNNIGEFFCRRCTIPTLIPPSSHVHPDSEQHWREKPSGDHRLLIWDLYLLILNSDYNSPSCFMFGKQYLFLSHKTIAATAVQTKH